MIWKDGVFVFSCSGSFSARPVPCWFTTRHVDANIGERTKTRVSGQGNNILSFGTSLNLSWFKSEENYDPRKW